MDDNKRIAINTIVLYAKLIINIIVSFVSSRLVLDALGASDFGLYNIVGGIVTMLNILGTAMVATSYRYMAVEIGKGENGNPNKVFNTVNVIHWVLAVFLILAGELVGVPYINNFLNVDPGKISDAIFVFHLSLITAFVSVITVPLNGLIIAREKFVFTSIVESLGLIIKLILIILLLRIDGNRLRYYAVFLAIAQLFIPISYQIYCRMHDSAILRIKFNSDIKDYKEVLSFSSWILLGAGAVIGKQQGAALIINYFFGTILNAAYGLANQVSSAVIMFTSTIRQAAIPQIMKSQSSGNEGRSLDLVYAISRYSFLCMNILAIPLLLRMEDVLKIWLENPPKYTLAFVNFMIISGMIANLGAGFDASIQATGDIKKNQIGYSIINLSLLPLIVVLYKLGFPPYVNVIVMAILSLVTLLFQIGIMKNITNFSISIYMVKTIKPSLLSILLSLIVLIPLNYIFPHRFITTFIYISIAILWTIISIYLLGLNAEERRIIKMLLNKIFKFNL